MRPDGTATHRLRPAESESALATEHDGGKYVIGNVEENGKKYREFPEKMRFFDGAGLLGAVRRGCAKSSYGCRSKHRDARKNNRPDCRAGDVPSTLHRMSGSGAPVAGGCRAAAPVRPAKENKKAGRPSSLPASYPRCAEELPAPHPHGERRDRRRDGQHDHRIPAELREQRAARRGAGRHPDEHADEQHGVQATARRGSIR
jgi:hypothetical protein